jgi:hypothetical protein
MEKLRTGDNVRLYYNLHRKDYTVQKYVKGVGWRKVAGLDCIVLQNVKFKVSEAGRQRVIREGKKNVHAYATGQVLRFDEPHHVTMSLGVPISYNPFKAPTFVDEHNDPVKGAFSVAFTKKGVKGWGVMVGAV